MVDKKILSHTEIYCFHGLVPRRYYLIQKTINTNSFHGYVQEDIISYRKDIISYRNLLFVWFCPKKILSQTEIYCFHGIVQRRYYLIQKNINTDSFHGSCPRRYYIIQKIINTNSRISEVDGCLPASSYISNRNLMYELAGDFT